MRGKELPEGGRRKGKRITPAHAGKRWERSELLTADTDHPRTCGEKSFQTPETVSISGSPPHMRGKGRSKCQDCCFERITPAHAGKSIKRILSFKNVRDHPRTCGEKLQKIFPTLKK